MPGSFENPHRHQLKGLDALFRLSSRRETESPATNGGLFPNPHSRPL